MGYRKIARVKNIIFVTPYFAPAWSYGGPPKVLYILARELRRKGKEVKVITTDALDAKRNNCLREDFEGVQVFRFKTVSNTLAYKFKIFIVPNFLERVKKILEEGEIILFSEIRSIINWQIYPYLVKRKIPYGIFAFGTIPYGCGLKAFIKKIFDKWWVKDFVKRASFYFAQTEH
ncbi:MAG: hypothetical protein QXO70_01595, partial [Candidatus Pacearchaeota archaeon]